LRFSFFIIILPVIFFLGCEEITTFNPLDPENNPEFDPPETTIISALDTVTTSSTVITWSGNADSMKFCYQLDSMDWSDWSSDTLTLLIDLVENDHQFKVKGRYYSGTEDDTPAEHFFTVDYIRPTTNIISGPEDGSTVDTSMVTFTWEIEDGSEYSYSLNNANWSNWSSDEYTATFDYLDEGSYLFIVKSRYNPLIEEEEPQEISFTVNALQGPGLRVYPLLSKVNFYSTTHFSIYAEEVSGLVLAEFQISFDPDIVDISYYTKGNMFDDVSSSAFVVEQTYGLLQVNFSTLGDTGLMGSGEIVDVSFFGKQSDSTYINIINPVFRDIDSNDIPIVETANGVLIVQ